MENSVGERLDLQSDTVFLSEPSGLGIGEDRGYTEIEYGFFAATELEYEQLNINGTLVFKRGATKQEPYVSYQNFVQWVQSANNLKLVYQPYSTRELYLDVYMDTLELSEKEEIGWLECPVVFAATSPWHKRNPISLLFTTDVSSSPMRFTFAFPFQFSASGAGDTQVFTPGGHFPAALELAINGPASNIYFSCEDANTGEIIGALDLTGVSVAAGDKIYYSSQPNADGIWLISGNTRTDIIDRLNVNDNNFILIPVGKECRATLVAETSEGAEITHLMAVHEYYKG